MVPSCRRRRRLHGQTADEGRDRAIPKSRTRTTAHHQVGLDSSYRRTEEPPNPRSRLG